MGKKKAPEEIPQFDGGSHAELYTLLTEERGLKAQLAEINKKKTDLAQMFCTEANMTESTRKSMKYKLAGHDDVIVVKRIDRLKVTDNEVSFKIDAAKNEYEGKIKTFKTTYAATKKLIEAQALEAGKAKKEASFYATFEGDKSAWMPSEEE